MGLVDWPHCHDGTRPISQSPYPLRRKTPCFSDGDNKALAVRRNLKAFREMAYNIRREQAESAIPRNNTTGLGRSRRGADGEHATAMNREAPAFRQGESSLRVPNP